MKNQATRDLFAYWNDLRRGRTAPERGEIEPAAIRGVLADTFMLDVDNAQTFPFRLAGTRVNGLFDAEQKGRSFLDIWRAEERRNIAAVLLTVADGACPVVAGGVAAPQGQVEEGAFEFLFLPLRHHGRTHARILGMVSAPASRRPAWLGLLPVGPMALRSLRIVDEPDAALQRLPNQVAVGQSVDFGTNLPAPGVLAMSGGHVRPSRPALRLIQGGRPAQ